MSYTKREVKETLQALGAMLFFLLALLLAAGCDTGPAAPQGVWCINGETVRGELTLGPECAHINGRSFCNTDISAGACE